MVGGPRRLTPGHRRRLRPGTVALLLVVAAVVVTGCVVRPTRVASDSMAPTLHTGDVVLVQTAFAGGPHRRDVIAFRRPGSGDLFVKRVVGVGGDEVGVADGVLVVDGRPVDEPFVDRATSDATYFGPVTVPAGTVFVMGDHRADSLDSRTFGPVPVDDIVGRVVLPG